MSNDNIEAALRDLANELRTTNLMTMLRSDSGVHLTSERVEQIQRAIFESLIPTSPTVEIDTLGDCVHCEAPPGAPHRSGCYKVGMRMPFTPATGL